MLVLDNVSVNYGAIEALRGISMHVEQGEVVTLIGANGAGKTTTLRTITGLLEPREGRVTFEGEDISGTATHKLVARGISMSMRHGEGVQKTVGCLSCRAWTLLKARASLADMWRLRSACGHGWIPSSRVLP